MWIYQGKEVKSIEDMPKGTYGFIYEITFHPTGQKYLGKKVLHFNRKKKLTKTELENYQGKGRKPTSKVVVSESDWKTYYGSQKDIKELAKVALEGDITREILCYVPTKKLLTYYEMKQLFIKEVLEQGNTYFNDNIAGKFYRKDFV